MDPMASALLEQVRTALATRDLDAFGSLLADDVRWGDDQAPRACRNRIQVLETFSRIMYEGAQAEIAELTEGPRGVLCELEVRWPEGVHRPGDRRLYHTYLVSDGRITEIRRYDDRASAAAAVGVPS
jgi:ketosteroid isomerase-like protein